MMSQAQKDEQAQWMADEIASLEFQVAELERTIEQLENELAAK